MSFRDVESIKMVKIELTENSNKIKINNNNNNSFQLSMLGRSNRWHEILTLAQKRYSP